MVVGIYRSTKKHPIWSDDSQYNKSSINQWTTASSTNILSRHTKPPRGIQTIGGSSELSGVRKALQDKNYNITVWSA